jgi:hypothetical protein
MYKHAPFFFIPRPLSLTQLRSFWTYSIRRLGRQGLSLQGICVPSAANTFAYSIILEYGHYLGNVLTQASQVASQPTSQLQPLSLATSGSAGTRSPMGPRLPPFRFAEKNLLRVCSKGTKPAEGLSSRNSQVWIPDHRNEKVTEGRQPASQPEIRFDICTSARRRPLMEYTNCKMQNANARNPKGLGRQGWSHQGSDAPRVWIIIIQPIVLFI